MEFKADALVLRAADWGEYDKIVTLFTAERGKLSAALKGVKRAGAKLKFAAQPFCFAEFVFVEKAGRPTSFFKKLPKRSRSKSSMRPRSKSRRCSQARRRNASN